jgi:hypothetical protein
MREEQKLNQQCHHGFLMKLGMNSMVQAYVEQEFVLKHGMAGYVKDLEQAETNDRVAGNPLTVKAVGVAGKNKTDIVLADQDAARIRQLAANLNFLREARVVVLVD